MDTTDIKTCKVCCSPLKGTLCTNCGWTLVIYPEVAPSALINQEKQRQEIMEQRVKELDGLKHLSSLPANASPVPFADPDISIPLTEVHSDRPPLSGVVIISDASSDRKQGLPIYAGTNTYGTLPPSSEGNLHHHQISLFTRSGAFLPEHFSVVVKDNRQLILYSLGNDSITSKGRVFESKKADSTDDITICHGGELYKINIFKF